MSAEVQVDELTFSWNRALTLRERVAAWEGNGHDPARVLEADRQRGAKRLERWRDQAAFAAAGRFDQRLQDDHLTEDMMVQLLGECKESLDARCDTPPKWLATLLHAYSQPVEPGLLDPIVHAESERQQFQFLYLIEPLISEACRRFKAEAAQLLDRFPQAPFELEAILLRVLPRWCEALVHQLDQTLVLELNVARLEERLVGDSPDERFASFIDQLREATYALGLLREYPVLARSVVQQLDKSVGFLIEFLGHLCADWGDLQSLVGNAAGQLADLQMNAGDTHCGGRSVMIAQFQSGKKLVYKPRSLAIDVHFHQLLDWLNRHGDHPPFRTLNVVDRGTHGWVEFVEAHGCQTVEEIQRFYRRQGTYVGLLYALGATDFHFENIMAAGEHPVLLDLESLFHPGKDTSAQEGPDQLAHDTILSSVLSIGLLPQRLFLSDDNQGVDISGMGATENQMSPDLLPYWEGVGSDEMRLERRRLPFEAGSHRPMIHSQTVRPIDYVEQVVDGFQRMYRLLIERRDALLADDGPLAAFRADPVRVILRHTRIYGLLLQESSHPDLQRDALDRDRLFDFLWKDVDEDPNLARVIAVEQHDLQNGDIPLFTTYPGSRDIWTSSGQCIADYSDETDAVSIEGRIRELDEEDLSRQVWFIRASFASTVTYREVPTQTYQVAEADSPADADQYLQAAMQIGDRLESLAVRNQREAVWLGLTLLDENTWSLISSGLDLYTGLPGIGLFLAYLGDVSGEERYTQLAMETLNTMQRHIDRTRKMASSVGGFTGWGGVVYSLNHLGKLWNDRALLDQAADLGEFAAKFIERDRTFDIIDGSAGCLGCLLSVLETQHSEGVLRTAEQCGQWLVQNAQAMERGVAWQPRAEEQRPLAGFSHGAAGIAWSLLKLADVTGNAEFRKVAFQAIDFERSLFSEEVGNWPDRRIDPHDPAMADDSPKFMNAWCNGAPGIGLARLDTLHLLDDEQIREEIATAVRSTRTDGFGDNHCLCHGDLGNLELLLRAQLELADSCDVEPGRLAAGILASGRTHGWHCGVPMHTETPGLMTGLAGIGYGLLRVAVPEQVPSVLTLAAPVQNR